MTVIIGAKQSVLSQIPKEILEVHPRLKTELTAKETEEMLERCISALGNEQLKGSHTIFSDIVRLIMALQISVAQSNFK